MKKKTKQKKSFLQVQVAEHAGFCFGVKRAVEMVEKILKENGQVFSCGPLIHNPQVIEELKKKGFCVVENPQEIPVGAVFIIRSHGITPELVKQIKKRKARIVDATCPFVKKAQKIARDFYSQGWQVVICGDPLHAEVIGINAQTQNTALIFDDSSKVPSDISGKRIGILCQTTQKIALLKEIIQKLLENNKSLVIENTICLDSSTKQQEAVDLAKKVDLMIVVGGKNSSNTTKLAQLSRSTGTKTFHIETEKELKKDWLKGVKKVGLTAGASTPQKAIERVVAKIRKMF